MHKWKSLIDYSGNELFRKSRLALFIVRYLYKEIHRLKFKLSL